MTDAQDQPQHWYSTNLVGVPATVLGSAAFNAHPVALHVAGTREAHPGLFALLDGSATLNEARDVFHHYLAIAFGLRRPSDAEAAAWSPAERLRWRRSWRALLQGWGMDANGPAGAVLKGWVESRFGLVPRFHGAPLGRFPSPAWVGYLEQKVASRYHGNAIYQQLDLLYEFCQWSLARFGLPGQPAGARHLPLWRGTHHGDEQCRAGRPTDRRFTLALNNLVSFSLSAAEAGCFGDLVFAAQVPAVKLLVYPGLLPGQVLQGEQEVLALGGLYDVERCDV